MLSSIIMTKDNFRNNDFILKFNDLENEKQVYGYQTSKRKKVKEISKILLNNRINKIYTSLTDFILSFTDKLYNNLTIRRQLLDKSKFVKKNGVLSEKRLFTMILIDYLEEAELTLSLIRRYNYTYNDRLLEIGGGLGFVYCYLKRCGYNIYGVEPSEEPSDLGFDGYYKTSLEIFKIVGVDKSNFYPIFAKDCKKLNLKLI